MPRVDKLNNIMSEWLKNNAWALIIAVATVVSTYSLYGYRISEFEKRMVAEEVRVDNLESANNQAAITLAQIQKDIEYIRMRIDRLAD